MTHCQVKKLDDVLYLTKTVLTVQFEVMFWGAYAYNIFFSDKSSESKPSKVKKEIQEYLCCLEKLEKE